MFALLCGKEESEGTDPCRDLRRKGVKESRKEVQRSGRRKNCRHRTNTKSCLKSRPWHAEPSYWSSWKISSSMKRTLRTGTVWQGFPKYAHLYKVVGTRATNLILDLWGCTRLRHTQANSSWRSCVSFKCTTNNCLTHVQLAHPNPTPQRVSHALHMKVSPVSKEAAAQGSHACGHILCFQMFGSP